MKFLVASSASSTAAVSESCVRLPPFSESTIVVISDCQVVIDEQRPLAHSVVGVVSLASSARAAAGGEERTDGHGRGQGKTLRHRRKPRGSIGPCVSRQTTTHGPIRS